MGTHEQTRRGRTIVRASVRVLAWTAVVGIAAALVVAVLVPRLGGGTPYVVLTGSMQPGLSPGTMVVARPVDVDAIAVGTVITYQLRSGRPEVVTHRVVGRGISAAGETVLRTQGDANPVPDRGWVRAEQVRGERWYVVPYLGYLTTQIGPTERRIAQGLVEALLLGYAAAMAVSAFRDRRTAVAS